MNTTSPRGVARRRLLALLDAAPRILLLVALAIAGIVLVCRGEVAAGVMILLAAILGLDR